MTEDEELYADVEPICPVTGTYCSGLYCEDYGCAKKAGIYDEESEL